MIACLGIDQVGRKTHPVPLNVLQVIPAIYKMAKALRQK
jgi:hypothetical protein